MVAVRLFPKNVTLGARIAQKQQYTEQRGKIKNSL